MKRMKLGIQLYSVRNSMAQDPLRTIDEVCRIGYRYLEVANHNAVRDPGVGFDVSAEAVLDLMKETGAEIVSAHIAPMLPERLEAVMTYHKLIGTKFLVDPMDFYRNREEAAAKARRLNALGAVCRENGFELLYHNHFHEFQILPGGRDTVYDLLLEQTDPELVKIELDTYWAMRGGQDPVELLKRLGKRVRLIHQKDYPAERETKINLIDEVNQSGVFVDSAYFASKVDPGDFTEIGTGIMDIQAIIDAAEAYGDVEYLILEQDHTHYDELESLRISRASFEKFRGMEF